MLFASDHQSVHRCLLVCVNRAAFHGASQWPFAHGVRLRRMKLLAILIPTLLCAQPYSLGPDSQRRPDVPRGKVTQHTWADSKIFPGTTRDYWVYVPAQYDASKPACLIVFQDGGGMVGEKGGWRVPVVFDNLIADKSMPVTIGVFVNPGVMVAKDPATQQNRFGRSYE